MQNVLRTLIYDDQVSLTMADTTALVNEGIRLHQLSPASARVFGKALSVMAFMSACLKERKGEISFSVKGNGTGGEICVSGNFDMRIRAYIQNTVAQETQDSERDCLGMDGSVTVVRQDGYSRPFVGACALSESGTVDGAFEEYYAVSEQLPTYIASIVELDDGGNCSFAGICVLQPLPFADAKTLERMPIGEALYRSVEKIKEIGLEQAAKTCFSAKDDKIRYHRAEYKCNCSRSYLTGVLVTLGESQLREIIEEDGQISLHCHYCNSDYVFDGQDVDKIFPKG